MRIIEPNQLKRRSIKKKRSKKPIFLLVVAALACLGAWQLVAPAEITSKNVATNSPLVAKNTNDTADPQIKNNMRRFSNQQFVDFYSNFAYPNSAEILNPPVITGNAEADKRIQTLAEARGYKLRSAPITAPVPALQGYLIQQKAQQPLLNMFAAGKKLGLNFTLTAAFRSIDQQRELFLSRLGAGYVDIATGKADASVIETLKVTAPPGYSRHHNGFTIDIACGDVGGLALLETACFDWLSKDNFKNSKEFGWIPSYPDGATSVGPEPEPWELVWVGRDSLLE